jgi:hypothetical protein
MASGQWGWDLERLHDAKSDYGIGQAMTVIIDHVCGHIEVGFLL